MKKALDGMQLTNEQRAVLWQLQSSNWSAKSDPYSVPVGNAVKSAYDEAKTAGETTATRAEKLLTATQKVALTPIAGSRQ